MPPADIKDILGKLPLRIGLYVPDDVLRDWFAAEDRRRAMAQAAEFAQSFECEFKYYPERAEGVFWKWVPAV
jgi:hypothetical protein